MKKIEQTIRNELKRIGIPDRYLGEQFLAYGLWLLCEDSTRLCCVSKLLYKDIAQNYHTSAFCVERNLRTLISVIWSKEEGRDFLMRIAGRNLERRPSNVEFLDMMNVYLVD